MVHNRGVLVRHSDTELVLDVQRFQMSDVCIFIRYSSEQLTDGKLNFKKQMQSTVQYLAQF